MKASGGDLFTDKVEINLYMFHPSMENGMRGEVGGTDVIAPQLWRGQRNVKFAEKGSDPEKLRFGISDSFIFGFSARASDGGLFLGTPRNKITTKIDKKPTCRTAIRRITSPVVIGE